MKKLFAILLGISFFSPLIAFAVNITVPSAPGSGYFLVSTTTGTYVSTSTPNFTTGFNLAATSTGSLGINLSGGCFAINNSCIGNGAASSTLLSDNNTFSGIDIFSKLLRLSATTSALLATDAIGNVIATTSVGTNYLTGVLTTSHGGTGVASFTVDSLLYSNHAGSALLFAATTTTGTAGLPLALNGNQFTNIPNASTTNLTATTLWDTGSTNGLASLDANGLFSASTSIGVNFLIGTLPVTKGGTGAATLTGCLTGNGTGAITGSGTCNTSSLAGTGIAGMMTGWTGANTISATSTIVGGYYIATSTTATSTFKGPVQITNSLTSTPFFVGTSTTGCPAYGCVQGDTVDGEYDFNGTAAMNVTNANAGTCASSGFFGDGNILALNSDYAFFGFTNAGWTGSGCAIGSLLGVKPESTVIVNPTGNEYNITASSSAAVSQIWGGMGGSGFYPATNTLMQLTNSASLFIGTSSRSTSAALFITASTSQSQNNQIFSVASTTGTSLFNINGLGTIVTALSTGCVLSTSGTLSVTGSGCNSGTLTSITAGNGLNGGSITTSGTLSLKSYTATSTADTSGQLLFFTSTNATPATFGGNSALTFATTGSLLTATNASTTNATFATFLTIPNSSSQSGTLAGQLALDTTNDQLIAGDGTVASVNDPRRFLTFSVGTTTTWTGTSTAQDVIIPTGFTIKSAQCHTNVGTLNTQIRYGGTGGATFLPMLNSSTTININVFSSNNTPPSAATTTIDFGTPATAPTYGTCTLILTVTGT